MDGDYRRQARRVGNDQIASRDRRLAEQSIDGRVDLSVFKVQLIASGGRFERFDLALQLCDTCESLILVRMADRITFEKGLVASQFTFGLLGPCLRSC